MITQEAIQEYPALDLFELSRQVKVFLNPYSFVESAHLYHDANKAKYHIIFRVPMVPEGWDKIQEDPEEPKTAAELYAKFYRKIQCPVALIFKVDEVYQRQIGPQPLGPTPRDPKLLEEWEWSIIDGNNKIVTGFYPIISLGCKGDAKDLGMDDLVQSRKGVPLYEVTNTAPRRSNQRHKLKVRKIAASLWQEHPDWTIQSLAESNDINVATSPRVYAIKTLRDWIKDLAPNRSPGRRTKKV